MPWPGNVRELRNVIERLMIMVPGERVASRDLLFLDQSAGPSVAVEARPVADHAAARRARRLRAPVHPARARGAAGQHLTHRGRARRRAQQSVPEDALVSVSRRGEPRRTSKPRSTLLTFSSSSVLQYLVPAEPGQPCSVCSGCGRQRGRRHQSDDLRFPTTVAPRAPASPRTASNARIIGVCVRSSSSSLRPARCRGGRAATPMAFTKGRPPLLCLDRRCDGLCDVEPVGREVDVERNQRRAARRSRWRRRLDGAAKGRSPAPIRATPSLPRALRTRRAGCRRGCVARRCRGSLLIEIHGQLKSCRRPRRRLPWPAPRIRAIVAPLIGMNGTTSTAPSRG